MKNLSLTSLRTVCTGADWIITEGSKEGRKKGETRKGKAVNKGFILKGWVMGRLIPVRTT